MTSPVPHPPVRFATAEDGVRIACCEHGAGPPLVFARGWLSNLELHWQNELYRAYWLAVARGFRLIRFDMRGNGLSDRQPERIDLEAMIQDIEAVRREFGLDRFVLYATCYGGPAAMVYASRWPERVERLILDGTYASGPNLMPAARRDTLLQTFRDLPEAGFLFTSHITHPDPTDAAWRHLTTFDALTDPDVKVRLYELGFSVDVTDVLPRITVPTLVLHAEASQAVTRRHGRFVTTHIPNARYVGIRGSAHNLWEADAAAALAAIGEFLGVTLPYEAPETPQ